MTARIVLAYTGDGDVCEAVRQLAEIDDGAEVVTLTLDLGQGRDLEEIRDRALSAGAVRAHVLDVRDEFVRDFVLPVLQAGVAQTGPAPLAEALGQTLLAQKLVEIAAIETARSIAHGERGEHRQRLEASLAALDDGIRTITLPVATGPSDRAYANLWGRARVVPRAAAKTLDTPASVEVFFERGVPMAINGVSMTLAELIESLAIIGERHGVGRIEMAERETESGDDVTCSSRVYEAPAAAILHAALRALEVAVVPSELIQIQREQAVTYAQLVYDGRWFADTRTLLDVFSATVQQMVTGTVRVKLFGGALLSSSMVERSGAGVPRS